MSLNLFEIAAKITLDSQGFESGINKASGQADSLASKLSHGLGNAVKAGAAAMAAGAAAAGAALTKLISDSTQAYAQYEQAIGGVETLFGDDAAQVMADAQEAYITTGQSATEYMQNVVSTSAALIRSLEGDTKEAARLSNMALKDMADNANKMGTSIESLQNAYTGFSRGNFQMLDNLSLGFAGTKEGMQELLDYAYELTGEAFDIDSYADIVEAIHAVQEAMEITGTTAEEASKTIAGSTAAMKASWQNLVAGLATPGADMGQLVEQMVDTSMQAATNWLGAVGNAVDGVKALFSQIGPAIEENWPEIQSMLGDIVGKIFGGNIFSGENLLRVAEYGSQLLQAMFSKAADAAPKLLDALFGQNGLLSGENISLIVGKGVDLISALFSDTVEIGYALLDAAPGIIEGLITALLSPEMVGKLVDCGIDIIKALFSGDIFETIWEIAKTIVDSLINSLFRLVGLEEPNIVQGIENMVGGGSTPGSMGIGPNQDFADQYLSPIVPDSYYTTDPFGHGDLKIPEGWDANTISPNERLYGDWTVNQSFVFYGGDSGSASQRDVIKKSARELEALLR